MARTPLTSLFRDPEPERPALDPVEVTLWEDGPSMQDGARVTPDGDGGVVVDFSPFLRRKPVSDKFDDNLADSMEDAELASIASDLMAGIKADDDSRQEWLATHAEGIDLLGFKIETARTTAGATAAPLEGMSTAKHPLLADACVQFQAVARGEMLPAAGPVKVRDDRPPGPEAPAPMMGHNGGPPLDDAGLAAPGMAPPGAAPAAAPGPIPPPPAGPPAGLAPPAPPPQPSMVPGVPMPVPGQDEESDRDLLAAALEKDFNHYLTTTATEYYPDTTRMLFGVGFGGQGVKKVYNCPLRRRPVSESIAMEDFIVSNALTDLKNAARITHKITMRPSVLKRMQLLGVYRDIELGAPVMSPPSNPVADAKAEVVGVSPRYSDPKDADYELYECYCELELDEFAPAHFRGKGLALPYRVTIERDSQTIVEIRRNWREGDKECTAKEFFVEFPYIKAFGFYGIGLLHLLGNMSKTLTAIVRLFVDNGMFANFPGFLYAKGAGRQLTNQFRVPPGGGVGLDIGLQPIANAVMQLPYKDLTPGFAQFVQHLEDLGRKLGGTANINVGEGKQDAPVGTTLALIEQATKPIGSVLKGLHAAASREFQLLADRFREDPEAFWRFNRRPARKWQKDQFLQALNDFDLVPVSDPNNPTKLHRAAKSAVLERIITGMPGLLNPQKVWARIAQDLEIADGDDLLAPPMPQQQPPVDQAKMASAVAKAQGDQLRAQTELQRTQIQQQGDLAELELRREIAMIEQSTEQIKLAAQIAIHGDKMDQADRAMSMKLASDHAKTATGREYERAVAREAADRETERGAQ